MHSLPGKQLKLLNKVSRGTTENTKGIHILKLLSFCIYTQGNPNGNFKEEQFQQKLLKKMPFFLIPVLRWGFFPPPSMETGSVWLRKPAKTAFLLFFILRLWSTYLPFLSATWSYSKHRMGRGEIQFLQVSFFQKKSIQVSINCWRHHVLPESTKSGEFTGLCQPFRCEIQTDETSSLQSSRSLGGKCRGHPDRSHNPIALLDRGCVFPKAWCGNTARLNAEDCFRPQ